MEKRTRRYTIPYQVSRLMLERFFCASQFKGSIVKKVIRGASLQEWSNFQWANFAASSLSDLKTKRVNRYRTTLYGVKTLHIRESDIPTHIKKYKFSRFFREFSRIAAYTYSTYECNSIALSLSLQWCLHL